MPRGGALGCRCMPWLLVVFLGALVLFQIWVTWRVWRADIYLRSEKLAQMRLIWLLPALGAVMVYSVLSEDDRPPGPKTHIRG